MNNQLVGASPRKHLNPERSLLKRLITRMLAEVMDGKRQRIAAEQGQGQVEPQMDTLIMEHVRRKLSDRFENRSNRQPLASSLANLRAGKREEFHGVIQFRGVWFHQAVGHRQ